MDITVQEYKERLSKGEKIVLIDVREPDEYAEANLGGKLIPLGNIASALNELAEYKDSEIVVHCRSGKRSASAVQFLKQNGFANPRNMTGGILAWQDAFGKTS